MLHQEIDGCSFGDILSMATVTKIPRLIVDIMTRHVINIYVKKYHHLENCVTMVTILSTFTVAVNTESHQPTSQHKI